MADVTMHSLLRVRVPRFNVETAPLRLPSDMKLRDAIIETRPMCHSEHKTKELLQFIETAGLGFQVVDCVEKSDLLKTANEAILKSTTRLFNSTLHPPEELSLSECMDQSLHALGLFPSGSVTLYFSDDESPGSSSTSDKGWSIHVKPVKAPNDVFAIRLLKPLDTVHTLKSRIAVQRRETLSPSESLTVVASGRVLDPESTLVGAGLVDGATVVCLRREEAKITPAPPSSLGDQSNPSGAESEERAEEEGRYVQWQPREQAVGSEYGEGAGVGEEEEDEDDEVALCRICHGGDEDFGPMLTPCRCTGSMRHVHLSCLNTWRRVAPTERSFTTCDQCGYDYQFKRTRVAAFLLSDQGGYALAMLACLALLYGGAWAVELLMPPAWKEELFRNYAWRPSLPPVVFLGNRALLLARWFPRSFVFWQRHLEFVGGGAYVFGSFGFTEFLREEWAFWQNHRHVLGWANPHTFVLMSWFVSMSSSGSMGRVVVVIGFLASARLVVLAAHQKAKEFAQTLGERMLEFSH